MSRRAPVACCSVQVDVDEEGDGAGETGDGQDLCRAIPDARYCVLADAFKIIADWFEERDRYGAVFTSSVTELNGAFQRLL